jgi:hypothetical protein
MAKGRKMNLRIAAVIALVIVSVLVLVATASIEKNKPEIVDDNAPKPTSSESAQPAISSASILSESQFETHNEIPVPSLMLSIHPADVGVFLLN